MSLFASRIVSCLNSLKVKPFCKSFSSNAASGTILRIPKANVFRFGDGNTATPVFEGLEWAIRDGESWAIVGPAGNEKSLLLEVLSS